MFNLTGSEIVVILLLALVILGPEKLPDAIRRFGRTYAELKRMSSGFQSEFRAAIDEPMREMRDTADMLGRSMEFGDGGSDASPAAPAPSVAEQVDQVEQVEAAAATEPASSSDEVEAAAATEPTSSTGDADPS